MDADGTPQQTGDGRRITSGGGPRIAVAVAVVAVLVLVAVLMGWAARGSSPPGGPGGGDEAPVTAPVDEGSADAARARASATPDVPPRARVDRFDGDRAFALLREQVLEYGPRPAGSPASRRLAVRLRRLLPAGRLEAVAGHPGLRNVVGVLPGRRPAIVVGAHYDTEATVPGHVGANDGAAGTAAVVELARALRALDRRERPRELRFVLFDGEEEPPGSTDFLADALRGSRAYVDRHGASVRELVLLDYIAEREGLRYPREGSSDERLWRQLRGAARAVGVGELFPDETAETIYDDHTPFLQAGIPAIDVIDFDYPQADTTEDDLNAVSDASLDATGEAVFELIRRRAAR